MRLAEQFDAYVQAVGVFIKVRGADTNLALFSHFKKLGYWHKVTNIVGEQLLPGSVIQGAKQVGLVKQEIANLLLLSLA